MINASGEWEKSEWGVFGYLCDNGESSAAQISGGLSLSLSEVVQVLQELASMDFVRKYPPGTGNDLTALWSIAPKFRSPPRLPP